MSALRQKIEDMQIRNYSPHTIEAYVRCVAHLPVTLESLLIYSLQLTSASTNFSWYSNVKTVGQRWSKQSVPYASSINKHSGASG